MEAGKRVEQVLDFWFAEKDAAGQATARKLWYQADPGFDREIRERFLNDVELAAAGKRDGFSQTAQGALALILLLDQFPRNLFRNTARAFTTDGKARATAEQALAKGFDRALPLVERSFFYLPYMHSESRADQQKCIALFEAHGNAKSLDYARRHAEIIERFGRFPHRNAILRRESTKEELEFLNRPDSGF